MLHLIQSPANGEETSQDIIHLVPSLTWAGDLQQAARSLDYEVVQPANDTTVPRVSCDVGGKVLLMDNDTVLFEGHIFSRERHTDSSRIAVHCFDWGFYLKQNHGLYKFTGQTPEQIARRLCNDFGIPAGSMAYTGVPIHRNFIGDTLYDILLTSYTMASRQTGKQYYIHFQGRQLYVMERGTEPNMQIGAGTNLIGASLSESVENMVNQVAVYDKNDNLITTIADEEAKQLYGVMQRILRQSGDESVMEEARALLKENGYSQQITVECLGGTGNRTGGCVTVREPTTGLQGLFYIDGDTHTWKNGQYFNKLTLNFKSIMDEQDAGQSPEGNR